MVRFLYSFNTFIEKRMAFVTPACLLFGVLFADSLSHVLFIVPYVFAFMTFCGSLGSRFGDLKRVFQHPMPLMVSLFVIHLVVPLLANMVGSLLFPGHPYTVTGMVLEFVVPNAVVSSMWVSIYRGSVPFTLSIILIDTLLAPFLVPFSLHHFVGSNVQVNTAAMMEELLLMVAVPAVLAMTLNQFSGGTLKQTLSPKLAPFGKIALMIVVAVNSSKVAPFIKHMNGFLFAVTGTMLVIAASGYAIGWACALLLRRKREMIVSMTYACGMRNISAGAVIAAAYFPAEVMFPVMIGTLFQQVLAAFYAQLLVKFYGTGEETT
ncbi:MAG: bile acid:sodium symporter family protein [Clostridiales bacterium]|nr:bile acid:sodium symporter family protein [Clostridiales bacterium]